MILKELMYFELLNLEAEDSDSLGLHAFTHKFMQGETPEFSNPKTFYLLSVPRQDDT